MRRLFIAISIVFITGWTGAVLAQNAQETPTPPAVEGSGGDAEAAGEVAEGEPNPATPPQNACEGMIAEAELIPACEAALRDNDKWREGLGRDFSARILELLDRRKAKEAGEEPPDPKKRRGVDIWVTEIADTLANRVHQDEFDRLQRNNRHLVMAYAALWALMLLFVMFMWMKQRALKGEIAQLKHELEEAADDE